MALPSRATAPGSVPIVASAAVELGTTLFLTALAGVSLGLLVSAFAATPDKAMSLVPITLIPQNLFAGSIFPLEGGAEFWSCLTASRWSLDALGAIVDLNALPSGLMLPLEADPNYTLSAAHLIGCWLILLSYGVVCLILTAWLLRRQDMRT